MAKSKKGAAPRSACLWHELLIVARESELSETTTFWLTRSKEPQAGVACGDLYYRTG